MTYKPQPNAIPPWQDAPTLAWHLSISLHSVENWVAAGIIPPGRQRGGKVMWKWAEVDAWMMDGNPAVPGTRPGSIRDGVRREREADRRAGL